MTLATFEPNPAHDSGLIPDCAGRMIDPLALRADDIRPGVIAHHLAMRCRWNGAGRHFYSVAEHSVLLVGACLKAGLDRETQIRALLHDAAEAYVPDMPSPLARRVRTDQGGTWGGLERAILRRVFESLGLPRLDGDDDLLPASVRELDQRIRCDEARALLPYNDAWDYSHAIGVQIQGWAPRLARLEFAHLFARLWAGSGGNRAVDRIYHTIRDQMP